MEIKQLLHTLDHFPPYVIRMMARKKFGRVPMPNAEIARKAGLSLRRVAQLSMLRSWRDVTVAQASAFCEACGCDILRPRRLKEYVKRNEFFHMRRNKRYLRYMSRLISQHDPTTEDDADQQSVQEAQASPHAAQPHRGVPRVQDAG